ncbi:MAG TPA: ABC transporter substrate-binding protein [Stellaceae bacterium]|nr:ABC transporter substrate-binding protein [Stellaceae bacterium]
MQRRHRIRAILAGFALAAFSTGANAATEIRVACYSDGNECEATQALLPKFEKEHPDVKVVIDKQAYKAILESLPVQLAAGEGPDIARTTDFGIIAQYFLDLRPLVKDAAYWDANYGPTLDWLRADPNDKGIYGLPTQITVSAPFVNKTLFEQAKVEMPGAKATWEDWAKATKAVAKATGVPFAMAWDRSGHRFSGPAVSQGAKYFAADGAPAVVDDAFKAMARSFVAWNQDGTMPKEVWGGQGGGGYRDAFEEFANGQIVLYLSGSWNIARMEKQIGTNFDWVAVPNPCGPAACSGMPGGAEFVAFKTSKHPKEVAAFLDFMASEPIYAEWMSMTRNIPANASLQKKGVEYALSPAGTAAMKVFVQQGAQLSPVAYRLQGYRYKQVIFNPIADRLGQAVAGQITVDQALDRITADVKDQLATAMKK